MKPLPKPTLPAVSDYVRSVQPQIGTTVLVGDWRNAYFTASIKWLNENALQAFKNWWDWLLLKVSALPFQESPLASRWMTELWDVRNPADDGAYVGLRGKWFSNIALPETHDCMAVSTSEPAAAQDKDFEAQLLGGIRSFDMRYVDTNAIEILTDCSGVPIKNLLSPFYQSLPQNAANYVGVHTTWFRNSTMDGCVAALRRFFDSEIDRSHEFILLKLRFGTGDNNDAPRHCDATAMRMFAEFVDKLKAAKLADGSSLQDRVLPGQRDASGNHLPDQKLPIATLEKLNVNSAAPGKFKNLFLTLQPDYLMAKMRDTYPEQAAFYWTHYALWREDGPFTLDPPHFAMSTFGVDANFLVPQKLPSAALASIGTDSMLYNPNNGYLVDKGFLPRNAYASPINYNCISANFFADTAFVNNVVQLNRFNDYTDIYPLKEKSMRVFRIVEHGYMMEAELPLETYYGSLQLAEALDEAVRRVAGASYEVTYDGRFTVSNVLNQRFLIMPTELSGILGFPPDETESRWFTGSVIGPRQAFYMITTPWLATRYAGKIQVSHPLDQYNRVVAASTAFFGKVEVIYQGKYGLINMRIFDSRGQMIKPDRAFHDRAFGDNWVAPDFGDPNAKPLSTIGSIDGIQFGYEGGHGLVNVRMHLSGKSSWERWLSPVEEGKFNHRTEEIVLTGGISSVAIWREGGYGLVDAQLSGSTRRAVSQSASA